MEMEALDQELVETFNFHSSSDSSSDPGSIRDAIETPMGQLEPQRRMATVGPAEPGPAGVGKYSTR